MTKDTPAEPFARLRGALCQRRKALNLSITETAEVSHVGASKIKRLEEDEDSSPRLIHVARLARAYGMGGDEIFALLDLPLGPAAYHTAADGHETAVA